MAAELDFITTFKDRRQCFADLLQISRSQLGLVETDDYSQLLRLLGGKQQIISRLEGIASRSPQLWDKWRSERQRLAPGARETCEQTLAETESLLAELLEHERIATETLARRRDQTAQQLAAVAGGSRVNQAYRDCLAPVTHRHLDLDQ
jgi:hypothetical protein